jgi:hypothetical protein
MEPARATGTADWPLALSAGDRTWLWSRWADRYVDWDPALSRLRAALQAVLVIGAIMGGEALFVHFTHELQIQVPAVPLPAAAAAKVAAKIAAANHELLVIAILLGVAIGLASVIEVADKTASSLLVSLLILPVPMIGALALGIWIGGHRVLVLTSFAVLVAIGTYGRRFGPRGSCAVMLFVGDFAGFLLHSVLTLHDLGWLAAEVGVATGAIIVVRLVFFCPRPARALRRAQRLYAARVAKVGSLALALFDGPHHTAQDHAGPRRQLHRQLLRLNEAALMIDANLGDPGAVPPGRSARLLHQRLFDAELAVANVVRFAEAMARGGLPAEQRLEARLALRALVQGEHGRARAHAVRLASLLPRPGAIPLGDERATVVVTHRFASSVIALVDAITQWMDPGAADENEGAFKPSVRLYGGWLPGSAQVSGAASRQSGIRWWDRARLAPYTRTAIQVGVAFGAATAAGDALSPSRFYWADLSVFFIFIGANTTGEQVRKAFFRVIGTLVGVIIGSLLVTAAGHHTYWTIVVILGGVFFGIYLMRINYGLMMLGMTVVVSQLYLELGEFSHQLLELRLKETALGAAIAVIVVIFVLPLRTRRVLDLAFRDLIEAVARLVGHVEEALTAAERGDAGTALRSDARAVDAAYQALLATARPLRRTVTGGVDEDTADVLWLAAAARNYSGSLVADAGQAGRLDPATRRDVEVSGAALTRSMAAVAGALSGKSDGIYTRSSALFDQAERRIEELSATVHPAQLAIQDFMQIDGTMAQIADRLGLPVTDYDTARW